MMEVIAAAVFVVVTLLVANNTGHKLEEVTPPGNVGCFAGGVVMLVAIGAVGVLLVMAIGGVL